ncbi:MAG: hypothetical protein WCA63_01975 [Gallionella sp.]
MPIMIDERYKQMLAQLQFASEIRFKILAAWGGVYAALAATFVWVESSSLKSFSWVIPLLGIVITLLFWAGDKRNGSAVGAAKDVGIAIEEDKGSDIPEKQRYFYRLNQDKGMRFGEVISIFAITMLIILSIATGYLFCNR